MVFVDGDNNGYGGATYKYVMYAMSSVHHKCCFICKLRLLMAKLMDEFCHNAAAKRVYTGFYQHCSASMVPYHMAARL